MKKLTTALLLAFLVSFLAPKTVGAFDCRNPQDEQQRQICDRQLWYNYDAAAFKDKVFGPPPNEVFGERYTLAQVNWIINSLSYQNMGSVMGCMQNGGDPREIDDCLKDQIENKSMGGPLMFLAHMNEGILNTRPVSGIDYLAQKVDHLSPIKTAYAQRTGYGFRSLTPLQNIWLAARNVSFALMSFVIVILAFMILFRQKISAQAVVTVQSALPRVAVALIVITFSFAIAGFMVDLAYVVMGLFSAVLAASGLISNANPSSVLEIMNNLNAPIWGFSGWIEIMVLIIGIGTVAVGGLATAASLGAAAGVVGIAGAALVLILGLILAVAFFRILIVMLKAYATSIFLIIGFPFVALLSIVSVGPGIGGWIRQFAAQLTVFVGISIVVMLSHLIFWNMSRGVVSTVGDWSTNANPYHFIVGQITGDQQFPAFGGFDTSIIGFFIGFGILFSAPKIATGLRDQVATGRGSYGFDTGGTILGPGYAGINYGLGARSSVIENQAKLAGVSPYSLNPVQYPLIKALEGFMKRIK